METAASTVRRFKRFQYPPKRILWAGEFPGKPLSSFRVVTGSEQGARLLGDVELSVQQVEVNIDWRIGPG